MVLAIIQARMGSKRLPQKVMMDLSGNPVIYHVYNRTIKSKYIDKTIIATSENKENNLLKFFLDENNIEYVSGSENNVLSRFILAINKLNLKDKDHVVRITADCPMIDPNIINQIIELHVRSKADYTSNTLIRTYPDGLDCEIINVGALKSVFLKKLNDDHKEHVTSYITENRDLFHTENLLNTIDHSHLRWTLDYMSDYEHIRAIYKNLFPKNNNFKYQDILNFLAEKK